MRDKLKTALERILSVLFWLAIWEIAALVIDNDFLLPDIIDTGAAILNIFSNKDFGIVILYTAFRVIIGLLIGIILGVILGFLAYKFKFFKLLIEPFMIVVKSTPIASFIILLWLLFTGNQLAIIITVLMVFPIITENVIAGLNSQSEELLTVAKVFKFSPAKTLLVVTVPTVINYLVPAIITSVGLAWKAEVAAEIIGYVSSSVGQEINDAKSVFDTPTVFGWTVIIILFSLILDFCTKRLFRRIEK